MTPADHANTVPQALALVAKYVPTDDHEHHCGFFFRDDGACDCGLGERQAALAALDALQAQAEDTGEMLRVSLENGATLLQQERQRAEAAEARVIQAIAKLDGCLNDERAWEGEELVALMEDVRATLAPDRADDRPPPWASLEPNP